MTKNNRESELTKKVKPVVEPKPFQMGNAQTLKDRLDAEALKSKALPVIEGLNYDQVESAVRITFNESHWRFEFDGFNAALKVFGTKEGSSASFNIGIISFAAREQPTAILRIGFVDKKRNSSAQGSLLIVELVEPTPLDFLLADRKTAIIDQLLTAMIEAKKHLRK